MNKFNILTFSVHEGWETNLCKTGHNFYAIKSPERSQGWKVSEREIPDNYYQISNEEAQDKLSKGEINIFLYHTPFEQRKIATHMKGKYNVPIIEMNHCLPILSWGIDFVSKLKVNSRADLNVFTNEEQRNMWMYNDINTYICGHTVNKDVYVNEYTGELRNIISVAYDFLGRKDILGYDDWEVVANKFPVLHFGDEKIGKVATDYQMSKEYIINRAFLNTAYRSTLPTSMLEAMSCGMPVITCKNGINENLFTDGLNGFVYEDVFDLLDKVEFVLKNQDKAIEIGKNGNELFKEKFNEDIFINNWNNIFNIAKGKNSD